MPEERKLVTVLFTDIVGSTAMGLSHDPEVVRASLAGTAWKMGEAMIELGDDAGAREVLAEAVDLFTRRGQRE